MMAFPGMLVDAAVSAGISVPDNVDDFDPNMFPHFHVFLACQLGQSMPYPGVHYDNATVIAEFTEAEIKTAYYDDIIAKGFQIGNSNMYV